MKIFKYTMIFLALLVFGIYMILFTSFGNSIVVGYIENTIKQKSGLDVKFVKFQLNLSEINLIATINNEILAQIDGKLNILSQKMDLNYNISANDLKTAGLSLVKPIGLKGQVKGIFKDFDANGTGDIFKSGIRFLANIKEYKPLTLIINAEKLNIAEILTFAKQPSYLNGLIDITANIKENDNNPQGVALINIYNTKIDQNLILQDFNITLPANFNILATSNININSDNITAKTEISTPITKEISNNLKYNLKNNEIKTNLNIKIADLLKLEPIIKQKLIGSLETNAQIEAVKNKLSYVDAKVNGLGGSIDIAFKNDTLNAKINALKLEDILKLMSKPSLADAKIDGTLYAKNLDSIKNLNAKIEIKTKDGEFKPQAFKELGLNMPNDTNFKLNTNAVIEKSIINFNANFLSSLINLKDFNGFYNLENKNAQTNFALISNDLTKLEKLVGTKLNGGLNLNGNAKIKNNILDELNISGIAFGGNIKATSNGKNLNIDLNNLALKDIFLLLGQKAPANANLNINAKLSSLDPKNLNGDINLNIQNGEFDEKIMSEQLKKQFPKNIVFSGKSNIKLTKNIANFNGDINSDLVNIKNLNGDFNINNSDINTKFDLSLPDLRRLKFITEKELHGSIDAKITASKNGKEINANATSTLFNGNLKANLKNENIDAVIENFTFKGLSRMLDFEHIYDGIGNAKFNYNLNDKSGKFNIDINEGRLVENGFTKTFKTFSGRDITGEIYKNGFVRGNIYDNLINFNAQMSAQRSDINITKGVLNMITSSINIPIDFRYEKTDAKITITGTTKEPKYNISSNYIKDKISKEVGKFLDKQLGNSNTDDTKESIKGLLKGLF